MTREYAVYNLELTLVDHVAKHALLDIRLAGLDPGNTDPSMRAGTRQQTALLLGWFANKQVAEVAPLLEVTAQNAADRISPWGRFSLEDDVQEGRTVAFVSSSMPYPIVRAYADGVKTMIPAADIRHMRGKQIKITSGRYTDKIYDLKKDEVVKRLRMEGDVIRFMADSFTSGFGALKRARSPLVVNGGEALKDRPGYWQMNRLEWRSGDPEQVSLFVIEEGKTYSFNLRHQSDQEAFIERLPK